MSELENHSADALDAPAYQVAEVILPIIKAHAEKFCQDAEAEEMMNEVVVRACIYSAILSLSDLGEEAAAACFMDHVDRVIVPA